MQDPRRKIAAFGNGARELSALRAHRTLIDEQNDLKNCQYSRWHLLDRTFHFRSSARGLGRDIAARVA
jgi:hypothetical protein